MVVTTLFEQVEQVAILSLALSRAGEQRHLQYLRLRLFPLSHVNT